MSNRGGEKTGKFCIALYPQMSIGGMENGGTPCLAMAEFAINGREYIVSWKCSAGYEKFCIMEGIMAEAKTPARIHAILPRKGNCGVVFRRGPSRKVAVIGWELDRDRFTVGQWFKGRIYEYRCELGLDGTYII